MLKYLWIYLATALGFCALDALWLGGYFCRSISARTRLAAIGEPRLGVAALFYLIFIVGIQGFAV